MVWQVITNEASEMGMSLDIDRQVQLAVLGLLLSAVFVASCNREKLQPRGGTIELNVYVYEYPKNTGIEGATVYLYHDDYYDSQDNSFVGRDVVSTGTTTANGSLVLEISDSPPLEDGWYVLSAKHEGDTALEFRTNLQRLLWEWNWYSLPIGGGISLDDQDLPRDLFFRKVP